MKAKDDLYKDPIRAFVVGNDAHTGKLYDLKMALAKKEGEIARHMIHYEYNEAQKNAGIDSVFNVCIREN
ncbi:TPA: hypothetical protein ACTXXA_001384 [Legionella anisa]